MFLGQEPIIPWMESTLLQAKVLGENLDLAKIKIILLVQDNMPQQHPLLKKLLLDMDLEQEEEMKVPETEFRDLEITQLRVIQQNKQLLEV